MSEVRWLSIKEAIFFYDASEFHHKMFPEEKMLDRTCLLATDKDVRSVTLPHEKASLMLGGPVQFVGAIYEADVFVVGLQDATDACCYVNHFCDNSNFFDCPVLGPVLFVSTDEAGEPRDVHVPTLLKCLGKSEQCVK